MDLHPDVFWDLSLSEFEIKAEGYFLRLDREWANTRYLGHFLHAMVTHKGISPSELMPLQFDEDGPEEVNKQHKKITKEDKEAFEKKWLNNGGSK